MTPIKVLITSFTKSHDPLSILPVDCSILFFPQVLVILHMKPYLDQNPSFPYFRVPSYKI